MRIRSIKPEFWKSDDIAALHWDARLIFIGLWTYVDDNGVGRDNESLILAELFPQDISDASHRASDALHLSLAALSAASLITRYTIDNRHFLHITNWAKHQKIDRPAKVRYLPPTSENAKTRCIPSETRWDASPGAVDQRSRGTGDQEETCPAVPDERPAPTRTPISFEKFWAIYPRKAAKKTALKAWTKSVRAAGGPAPIIAGAQRLRDDPNREDAFTPMPATWLNAERWDDGPLPSRSGSSRPTQTQNAHGWIAAGAALMDLYPDEPKELTA